jgi:molecular chaperone GrpE
MKQRKKQETDMEQNDNVNKSEVTNKEINEAEENKSVAAESETDLNTELVSLQKKLDEANDKYLRLYSEFDNFRKRALKERIELSKTASEQVIIDLLTILDDFERAIVSFGNVEAVEPVKEGTVLIYNKFRNNLVQKGLSEIEAMGSAFDTDFHEAVANVPAPSEENKGKVIDVAQKGYTLNGKVIRFAKVVVGN